MPRMGRRGPLIRRHHWPHRTPGSIASPLLERPGSLGYWWGTMRGGPWSAPTPKLICAPPRAGHSSDNGVSWNNPHPRSLACDMFVPWVTQNNLDYIQIEIFKVNPQRNRNIVVPTICGLSKQNISQRIHQWFGHVYITRLKMAIKVLMEDLSKNLPDL